MLEGWGVCPRSIPDIQKGMDTYWAPWWVGNSETDILLNTYGKSQTKLPEETQTGLGFRK